LPNWHIQLISKQIKCTCGQEGVDGPHRRLALTDLHRQRLREDRLWCREVKRARLLNLRQIHCPCTHCKGQRRYKIETIRDHLIKKGQDATFQVWRGPGSRDSSDAEWEENYWAPGLEGTKELDARVETRRMLDDAFQQDVGVLTSEQTV
jgi:hypothetical protein